LLERSQEIVMREEEALDRAVEHNDLQLLIGLDRRDDLAQLRHGLGTEDVARRVFEGHPPVRRQTALKMDLPDGRNAFNTAHDELPLFWWTAIPDLSLNQSHHEIII